LLKVKKGKGKVNPVREGNVIYGERGKKRDQIIP